MKIALTHPFCWPYVRRGSERFIAELARFLAGRGHEVITVSSKLGARAIEETDGGRRILLRQLWHPLLGRIRIQPPHTFLIGCLRTLASLNVDVIQSLTFFDAWSANVLKVCKRHRTVFQITGPIVPHHFPRIPPDRFLLRQAVAHADRHVVHSEFTAGIVRNYYGVEPAVIPVPIDLESFPLKSGPCDGPPIILHVASFAERRKGIRVMVKAFERVREKIPSAILRLSGHMPPEVKSEVIDPLSEKVRQGIEILGVGMVGDMGRLYREATLTVLPSMWEAYGMAVVESWACGTPVVVTHHGGLGDMVTDAALGLRFDPRTDGQETTNAEGLAEAILAALPLDADPQTRLRCRAQAERYTWTVLGPKYEALYI